MNRENVRTGFYSMAQIALLLALSLVALAGQSRAQTCSANMDFSDPINTRYVSSGSGTIAFRGSLNGNVSGRVRNGQLTALDVTLDTEVNGPNGLYRMYINYNASPSVAAPTFRCTPITGGVRINITHVPTAREIFQSDGTYSNGFADVEITFERTGPGRLNVLYQHSAFNRADSTPPRTFNGTIVNAVPQAGFKRSLTRQREQAQQEAERQRARQRQLEAMFQQERARLVELHEQLDALDREFEKQITETRKNK